MPHRPKPSSPRLTDAANGCVAIVVGPPAAAAAAAREQAKTTVAVGVSGHPIPDYNAAYRLASVSAEELEDKDAGFPR